MRERCSGGSLENQKSLVGYQKWPSKNRGPGARRAVGAPRATEGKKPCLLAEIFSQIPHFPQYIFTKYTLTQNDLLYHTLPQTIPTTHEITLTHLTLQYKHHDTRFRPHSNKQSNSAIRKNVFLPYHHTRLAPYSSLPRPYNGHLWACRVGVMWGA